MWGKRTGRKKMENMRRWGKRSGSKILRGMWGKRSVDHEQEALSYIICVTQPAVHMFFCNQYPNDDLDSDEPLPKNDYNLKGIWG